MVAEPVKSRNPTSKPKYLRRLSVDDKVHRNRRKHPEGESDDGQWYSEQQFSQVVFHSGIACYLQIAGPNLRL